MAFYFKLFPEIIRDGRLYIAEPPLYRIDDKKDPFVINKEDYINRYVKSASKDYKVGYQSKDDEINIRYLGKSELADFLSQSSSYTDDMKMLVDHYKVSDRLLEIILEEIVMNGFDPDRPIITDMIKNINIQHLMNRIGEEFPELYFDDKDKLIKGALDGKYQLIEISEQLIRKSVPLLVVMRQWLPAEDTNLVLKDNKTGTEHKLSLLGLLKILKKYQPNILHRFKGLGENDDDDIKTTIMDPNTRTLIRVNISDIENDMKVFQVLRGGSPADALARKEMMKNYKIPRDMIDT